ncbi:MAG: hypothetical protein JWQ30_2024, partial [Sediminibacterium sp.]|nr:hypothetical protein [Sediminibacterium sp.]
MRSMMSRIESYDGHFKLKVLLATDVRY